MTWQIANLLLKSISKTRQITSRLRLLIFISSSTVSPNVFRWHITGMCVICIWSYVLAVPPSSFPHHEWDETAHDHYLKILVDENTRLFEVESGKAMLQTVYTANYRLQMKHGLSGTKHAPKVEYENCGDVNSHSKLPSTLWRFWCRGRSTPPPFWRWTTLVCPTPHYFYQQGENNIHV